jgi:2-hydroxy-3-keto-5-methylthiopentenyl-1-phosphate phosphatase
VGKSSHRIFCSARELGVFRAYVNEFLEKCLDHEIPVYVASCGMDAYIETVLDHQCTEKARRAIKAVVCNKTFFDDSRLSKIQTPVEDEKTPYPLHKGEWALSIKRQFPNSKILGIGDGSSDFSMIGYVDHLFATRKLAAKCLEKNVDFEKFDDFSTLLKSKIFTVE